MKLRFLAVESAHVPERHQDGSAMSRPQPGGAFRYVGRTFDASAPGHSVVSRDAYECDAESGEGAYLAKCCREGDLIAADEATAKFCGVKAKGAAKVAKDNS